MDFATSDAVWGIIRRLQGVDGELLTPRAVAKIHAIIDECQPDNGPVGNQTEQAEWIRNRIDREP